MSRPRLLLLDPDDTRRERFRSWLQSQFDVVAIAVAARSHDRFTALKPDAVLAHARQPGSSGPRVCKELRALAGGQDCLMVVYGQLVGPRKTAAQIEKMREDCQVDLWLTREVEAIDLEKVLGLKLLAPPEEPVAPAPATPGPARPAPQLTFVSAARQEPVGDEPTWGTAAPLGAERKDALKLLGKTWGPLVERLPKDQDVTWGQILRARVNLHNLSVLLEKPVTPLIQELPGDRPLSVAEVLRARVTLKNLRIILSQRALGSEAAPASEG